MTYRVDSEVGTLRQVLLHRPGDEFARLTPANKDALLFDDVLWLQRAQDEHDSFAATLRERGAEVLYFDQLLTETLAIPEARRFVLSRSCDELTFGPAAAGALRGWLDGLADGALARTLIAGLTRAELLQHTEVPDSLYLRMAEADAFVLAPLPNHLFTRDTSCWIYNGVAVNSMRKPARRRETINAEAIYRWHPRFAAPGHDVRHWSTGLGEGPATLEGGDVLVIGQGAVLIGISERTSPMGVERVARRLFEAGAASTVVAVSMPHERAQMHLDTVMTMLDAESFIRYAGFGQRETLVITPGANGHLEIVTHAASEMDAVIAQALGLEAVRVLTAPQDSMTAAREQWNDACNVLAVSPGVVLSYERNVATADFLRSNGIEVLDVPGGELGRGRGGPRCMSCPISRDPA